jgi:hypothetical protein
MNGGTSVVPDLDQDEVKLLPVYPVMGIARGIDSRNVEFDK